MIAQPEAKRKAGMAAILENPEPASAGGLSSPRDLEIRSNTDPGLRCAPSWAVIARPSGFPRVEELLIGTTKVVP